MRIAGLASIDFAALSRALANLEYAAFRRELMHTGAEMAKRGIPIAEGLTSLQLLLECSLGQLAAAGPQNLSACLALTRLHSLAAVLIVSGYARQWEESRQEEAANSKQAEERHHRAASYVTRIYESERRKFSRDLHDEIGHDLILLKLYLEMILLDVKEEDLPGSYPRLRDAVALVSHTLEAVRRLVLDLGPAIFDDLGFMAAVKSYARQFSSRTGIQIAVKEGDLPKEIPVSHQVALYRVLQGALSNVLKHSRATHVTVSIGSMRDTVLIMVIEDDGAGFDPDALHSRRTFGITAMRERIEGLRGRFHISAGRSGPRRLRGTRIEVDLPLPGADEGGTA